MKMKKKKKRKQNIIRKVSANLKVTRETVICENYRPKCFKKIKGFWTYRPKNPPSVWEGWTYIISTYSTYVR